MKRRYDLGQVRGATVASTGKLYVWLDDDTQPLEVNRAEWVKASAWLQANPGSDWMAATEGSWQRQP